MPETLCPRCGHQIPNDVMPGAYPGALSRTDNETYVCSACGTHEGLEQATGTLTPQEGWPVEVPDLFYAMNQPPTSTPG